MCLASSPEVNQTVTPPPAAAPRALASPYEDDTVAGNLSQLRMAGSKGRKSGPKAPGADNSAQAVAPPVPKLTGFAAPGTYTPPESTGGD